jgi:hydroxymethylbilane synthase
VQKRLQKLEQSNWTGAIFAKAGLERLGLTSLTYETLEWMVSAPAQGIVGVACLESNTPIKAYLKKINCDHTALCAYVERSFLNTLEGGCTAPIGAFSKIEKEQLYFKGGLYSLDGKKALTIEDQTSLENAKEFGILTAKKILNQGGASLMKQIKFQL